MAQLAAFWAKLTILVSTMRFSDIVDILIVAYLIYNIIMLIRRRIRSALRAVFC